MYAVIKHKKIFMGISLVLMIVSVLSLVFRGFNLDTDFAGGMAVTYEIASEFSTSEVEAIVNEALGDNQSPSSVQKSGNEVIIKFGYDNSLETDEARSDFALGKIDAITTALEAKYGTPVEAPVEEAATEEAAEATEETATEATEETATEETATEATEATEEAATEETATEATEATEEAATEETAEATEEAPAEEVATVIEGVVLKNQDIVSPSTGQDLARSAFWMSLLACLAILLYVTFRFEFVSGVVAVVALVHDVLLLLGLYSLLQWSVDTNFIAAVLTVLGYSINNTIVIMDRIRENTRHARKETYAQIAGKSIMETLNRSINTTITTLLTIGMVYILGVPSIQAFSLPIIIGILIGFYSSVFDAGPLWAMWRDSAVNAKKKAAAK
ncbi:MAG: protein translocase subunit SecF [Clostridia bacterium]|nr:protein translocase subunit SecF [Clostridia bacterium]